MDQAAVVVKQLKHQISSEITIQLANLSLKAGRRVALLGLNGAGKTSLIKLLVGEIQADAGRIQYSSGQQNQGDQPSIASQLLSPYDLEFKRLMGYQADTMLSLMDMTGADYLKLCASLKNVSEREMQQALDAINQHWSIQNLLDKNMSQLSKGNLQKLAIAQAFINQPAFLFFDEPCQSLDPLEQDNFNQLLKSLKDFQLCLFSTHNVEHAIGVADDIILFHQSRIVLHIALDSDPKDAIWLLVTRRPISDFAQLKEEYGVSLRSLDQHLTEIKGLTGDSKAAFEQAIQTQTEIQLLMPQKEALLPLFRMIASGEILLQETAQESVQKSAQGVEP